MQISPAKFFIIIGLLFGAVYCLIVPPFQVPDEYNHFFRSWQITEGGFCAEKSHDNRLGGTLPSSLQQVSAPFYPLRFNKNNKTTLDTILKYLKIPLNPQSQQFIDFPNTAVYAPTAYIPQAIVIFIFKKLGFTPLSILYLTRFFTLIFWLSIIYISLKNLLSFQWSFVLMALLPASLFINATANADVMTNALAFLFLSFILKNIHPNPQNTTIKTLDQSILIGASTLISINKIAYFPLILLVFLINKNQFKTLKNKYLFAASLVLINLIAIVIWSKISSDLFIPFESYNPQFRVGQQLNEGVNPIEQINFIIHNPFTFSRITLISLLKSAPHTISQYIGKFGWEANYIPFPIIISLFFLLLLRGCYESPKTINRTFRVRFLSIGLVSVLSFSTIMYMIWVQVGGTFIHNLGGKYFIPIFPLFLIALPPFDFKNRLLQALLSPLFLQIFIVFTHVIATITVLNRYF